MDDVTIVAEDRLKAWSDSIEHLSNAATFGFSDFEAAGFQGSVPYFLSSYSNLITALSEISREIFKHESATESLFNRAVETLERYFEHVRDNSEEFTAYRNFHYEIFVRVGLLSRQPFISFDGNISRHIRTMAVLVADLSPHAAEAWSDGDLVGYERAAKAFEDFTELEIAHRENEADYRDLVFRSQELVSEALVGLRLPTYLTQVQTNVFDDNTRPTYVDFSCNSDEYLYGQGRRPGVLDLKRRLGGQLTPEETERVDQARKTTKQTTRKRPASTPKAPLEPKRPRTIGRGYTMSIENVLADIAEIHNDARFNVTSWAPSRDPIRTPPVANRQETLENYRPNLLKMLRQYRKHYYLPEDPPKEQHDRDVLLGRLEGEFETLRADIARKGVNTTSRGRLKEARLSAYALRYLRSLHMQLLLTSTPPIEAERLNQALIDRLDDWVLFEQAWNAGDEKSQREARSVSSKTTFGGYVDQRNQNINTWRELQNQLRSGPSEEAEEAEEPVKEESEEEEEVVEEEEHPEKTTEVVEPSGVKEGDIKNLKITGNYYIFRPGRPGRTVYVSEKDERQRYERAVARAIDSALGQREGGEVDKKREEHRLENERIERVGTSLAAKGPPDYEQIPRTTVFEKLAYMVVMTHWRFFQARAIL
ncbi:hypothetical protein F4804DRAFT_314918 [Jackrogersella minutella]|nr:hypothetical protein F4804DRAFT_314918 [Jackrogersella minutella]